MRVKKLGHRYSKGYCVLEWRPTRNRMPALLSPPDADHSQQETASRVRIVGRDAAAAPAESDPESLSQLSQSSLSQRKADDKESEPSGNQRVDVSASGEILRVDTEELLTLVQEALPQLLQQFEEAKTEAKLAKAELKKQAKRKRKDDPPVALPSVPEELVPSDVVDLDDPSTDAGFAQWCASAFGFSQERKGSESPIVADQPVAKIGRLHSSATKENTQPRSSPPPTCSDLLPRVNSMTV